jgi:hypothetical protein
MAAFLVVLGILGLAFGAGFWLGNQNAGQQERILQRRVESLLDEQEVLQDSVTELRVEAQTAVSRYEQLQETYKEVLPEGPMQELVALVKQQLDDGRSAERLAFLIRSARPPKNCSEPETKRFVVLTPAYDGPGGQISIADGALIVKASGQSAVDAQGRPEAWYDPSKKVKVEFSGRERTAETKGGIMPLRHSVIVEDREYRFTIAAGARSFAKVTFDSCDYP